MIFMAIDYEKEETKLDGELHEVEEIDMQKMHEDLRSTASRFWIGEHLKEGDYAMISSSISGVEDAENVERTLQLAQDLHSFLQEKGIRNPKLDDPRKEYFYYSIGHTVEWGVERSFFVYGLSLEEALVFGRRYGQDAVYYGDGFYSTKPDNYGERVSVNEVPQNIRWHAKIFRYIRGRLKRDYTHINKVGDIVLSHEKYELHVVN